MIKNLAFKGGGVKGIAYVGALKVLESNNLLNNLERVSGTSAGAMVATMVALGYTIEEIDLLMRSLDFSKFEKGWNPLSLIRKYGLYSGNYIIDFSKEFISKSNKKLSAKATFKDFKEAGCLDLHIFTCNVNTQAIVELSFDKTPNIIVAEALRASMSIPFFFRAFQFSQGELKDHFYVDGGVVYNYPLSFFDHQRFTDKELNEFSVGLYLYDKPNKPTKELPSNRPLVYSKKLFESLLDAQDILIINDNEQIDRSIIIDGLHYGATDFSLTAEDMQKLIDSGTFSGTEFIKKYSYHKI